MLRGFRTNQAGGGGSIGSKKYLYKDGSKKVAFDNGIYSSDSRYALDGGWTEESTRLSISSPLVASHQRTIITDDHYDLSEYTYLRARTNNGFILDLDISAHSESGYVWCQITNFNGTNLLIIGCGRSKQYFDSTENSIATTAARYTASFPCYISEIWLEK